MSSEAETLAKMLETWAVERRDAAKYHEAQGDFAISGSCEAQEDRLRQAAALIRELSGRVERLEEQAKQHTVLLKLLADNLGEYIDREGTVDVTVALTFETVRAALGDA